jgi:aryl-alcohol dehydrogenase
MIRGVNMGDSNPQLFIPRLVELVMSGEFPIEKLVRFYQLADVNEALADQKSGAAVKPIIRIA